MTAAQMDELEKSAEPWRRNLAPELDERLRGPRGAWWWTGRAPAPGSCPGVDASGTITSLPQVDVRRGREALAQYFDNTWTLTEVLFSALQGSEAFYRPPYHHLRHPLIFYYAHPAVLYVNKLRVAGLLEEPLNPLFEQVFETGVDEMAWDDMSKNTMRWPGIDEVHAYRRQVYSTVQRLIAEHPAFAEPLTIDSPGWALVMGFEHERIHIETTSVLMRELPVELLRRPEALPGNFPLERSRAGAARPEPGRDFPANPWRALPAGRVKVGKPRDWPSYGWDNEYGEKECAVRAFAATEQLISNGEFYAFVTDEGYHNRALWSETGWQWRSFRNAKWPTFWVPDGPAGLHAYRLRTVFESVPMPWDWPVEVNAHEARAFAAWKQAKDGADTPYRLLTETEHWRMRDADCRERDPVMAESGREMAARRNLNLAFTSPSPVDAFPAGEQGFRDVFGNVWQWMEDDFHGLPGFKIHPLYDDFSTPCFDGKHSMILGGSFVSTGDEASVWSRFHFRPHFFQHAGFRLARSDDGDPTCDAVRLGDDAVAGNVYETDALLRQYLTLHYAAPDDQLPYGFGPKEATDFPRRCAELVIEAAKEAGIAGGKALDVGCAVGRASFELARHFDEVLGVDLSASFVEAADTIKTAGGLDYALSVEGELTEPRTARVAAEIERGRVAFRQADACSLPPELVGYDAVLLANLLCRLPSPASCLGRMSGPRGLVRPGGLLVVISPYTWMEAFTPREVWLGGRPEDGKRSADGLKELLEPDFELLRDEPMPLVIREHVRKFQYIVSHALVWRRKA